MPPKRIFRVFFTAQGKSYELYAGKVGQADMYGFIEVEELVFGERTSLVVDPSEEQLKNDFAGVKKTYIPFHSIVRIDEVEKEGPGKVLHLPQGEGGTVHQFPSPPSKK